MPSTKGTIRLFQVFGITVFLHWSWFLVAMYETQRQASYSSVVWNVLEYVAVFAIVTMHEFGHALACRSVGGRAEHIVLWPLGGVAYVDPPRRPGATLWSIAAGPLVNVVLFPAFLILIWVGGSLGWASANPDVYKLLNTLAVINFGLLMFNILPIYPLDGGQILRSLLWFAVGPARSLMIATIIGFISVAGLIVVALNPNSRLHDLWFGVLFAFILLNCWRGWQVARALTQVENAPRHEGFSCPLCHAAPPVG